MTQDKKVELLAIELRDLVNRMENYPRFPKKEQRIYIDSARELLYRLGVDRL